jgi:hypothetical protein
MNILLNHEKILNFPKKITRKWSEQEPEPNFFKYEPELHKTDWARETDYMFYHFFYMNYLILKHKLSGENERLVN